MDFKDNYPKDFTILINQLKPSIIGTGKALKSLHKGTLLDKYRYIAM